MNNSVVYLPCRLVWRACTFCLSSALFAVVLALWSALGVKAEEKHPVLPHDPPPTAVVAGAKVKDQFGALVTGLGDVNGDGYEDVAISATMPGDEPNRVYVLHGGAQGLQGSAEDPAFRIEGETDDQFGLVLAPAGDVNGDGYADMAVGAPQGGADGQGVVYVFYGGAGGLQGSTANPGLQLEGAEAGDGFGGGLLGLGDVNGDGYADLAVGAPGVSYHSGAIYLYYGGDGGLQPTAATTIEGFSGDANFGSIMAAAGDVNGDGYGDLAVSSGIGAYGGGKVYVFHGGPEGITGAPPHDADWIVTSRDVLGLTMAGAGDVNGDGYDDLAVMSLRLDRSEEDDNFLMVHPDEPGTLLLFYGGAQGLTGTAVEPRARIAGEVAGDMFGMYLAAAGDVNGDGYDDLVVTSSDARVPPLDRSIHGSETLAAERAAGIIPALGKLYVLLGSGDGLAGSAGEAEFVVTGGLPWLNIPYRVTSGDVDGDGLADVLAGVPRANDETGAVYVFTGAAITAGASARDEAGQGAAEEGTLPSLADLRPVTPSAGEDEAADEGAIPSLADLRPAARHSQAADAGSPGQTPATPGSETQADDSTAAPSKLPPPVATDVELFGPDGDALGELPLLAVAAGDVNGDGRQDLMVGAGDYEEGRGRVYVYYGGAGSVDAPRQSDVTITGAAGDTFGRALAVADFNGDGLADLAVGAPGVDSQRGQAAIFYGTAGGLGAGGENPAPDLLLSGEYPNNQYGQTLAGAGDVNGDGYDELAVGAYGYDGSRGKAYVYHGGEAGLSSREAFVVTGEDVTYLHRGVAIDHNLGGGLAGAGDVNGDGYDDLVVAAASFGAADETRQQGKIYLFAGSAEGLVGTDESGKIVDPAFTAIGEQSFELLGMTLAAGDLNGDSYSDVVVGSSYSYSAHSGRVYIFYGGAKGLSGGEESSGESPIAAEAAGITLTGLAIGDYGAEETFGASLAVDDFDGDGYDDVAVGAPKSDAWNGKVYLLRGGALGVEETEPGPYPSEASVLRAGVRSEMLGLPLAGAGDVDGDGRAELAAGAAFGRQGWGQMYVFDANP